MSACFAVISDIHGNLEGLQAVLSSIEKQGISEIICIGDVVGYGADPELCWILAKKNCAKILKGNHEAMLVGDIDFSKCSKLGQQSALWTKAHVSTNTQQELEKLPMSLNRYGADFFHAAPEDYGIWRYLNHASEIIEAFGQVKAPLVFYGHTHRPRITLVGYDGIVKQDILPQKKQHITVELDKWRCYVNPGSVGQQRDSHTDASYAICNLEDRIARITMIRIPYRRLTSYRKIKCYGCGEEAAAYLIREKVRRDWFELISHWR